MYVYICMYVYISRIGEGRRIDSTARQEYPFVPFRISSYFPVRFRICYLLLTTTDYPSQVRVIHLYRGIVSNQLERVVRGPRGWPGRPGGHNLGELIPSIWCLVLSSAGLFLSLID